MKKKDPWNLWGHPAAQRSRGLRDMLAVMAVVVLTALTVTVSISAGGNSPNLQLFPDPSGVAQTYSASGAIDTKNAFFQSLGTNGRSCGTCHQLSDGLTVTPPHLQARFDATDGLDPIFRPVDGSNSPVADVSTVDARRAAYSMLLTKGLIRVGLPIPPGAEFSLSAVNDPYGFASASELSLFRRILPGTNLPFLTTVMWDGRESHPGLSINDDLRIQATDATLGHAQAANGPTQDELDQIVAFETSLSTAQAYDNAAGNLHAQGATDGPHVLSAVNFYFGINDSLGNDPTGATFTPEIFTLFQAWLNLQSSPTDPTTQFRESIARGEQLFNAKSISITGVNGLNDKLGVPVIHGTCGTCHDTPSVGNHSVPLPISIGTTDYPALSALDISGLPVYTLKNNTTGKTVTVTDPGRALITGKWADIGKLKGPILRGLAARAPYFHNGSAARLEDVINFYDQRFGVGFTDQEKADLAAFLKSL